MTEMFQQKKQHPSTPGNVLVNPWGFANPRLRTTGLKCKLGYVEPQLNLSWRNRNVAKLKWPIVQPWRV